MQMDDSAVQLANTLRANTQSIDPASKVTVASAWHSLKHAVPIYSTDAGMQIEVSDPQLSKAHGSILERAECAANTTLESDPQCRKQPNDSC
jgi:hypothetical protein